MDPKQFLDNFKHNFKLNSLISYTAIQNQDSIRSLTPCKSKLDPQYTDGLHMCNSLYLYTNPPPVGYGTPAPKTAETVLRAYEYNRKKSMKTISIGNWEIEDNTIHEFDDFPANQVTGNYIPQQVKIMSKQYLMNNETAINESLLQTVDWLKTTRADEMSKGRQTWDPESEKSITCAKAFLRTMDLIKENLDTQPTTLLELIQSYINMMSLDSLLIRKREVVNKKTYHYDNIRKVRYIKNKQRIIIKKSKIVGNENVMKFIFDYSRSFCSYIKHKERGKKDRRAIASANVILRTFLKVIETFHLKLSKRVPGNTIGIGGDEKKAKIITELKTGTTIESQIGTITLQGTEDATKWNECLTPSMFALVHKIFFSQNTIYSSNDKELMESKKLMSKISSLTFFIMSIKRIYLGPGLMIMNDKFYNRKDWSDYKLEELNSKTREWFSAVKISGKNYIEASPGFLMGMLNAASTTIGLLPSNFINIEGAKVTTLRSSDDSMTVYTGIDGHKVMEAVYQNFVLCKMIGINMSTKKTLFFPEGFGEYTSWYQDGEFIGQSGTETSSIRPGGVSPQEDFNSLAMQTAVLMRTHVINPMGAIQRMLIGINNIRRLYHIKVREEDCLSDGVRYLSDGGKNPWNLETLNLDESTLRLGKCVTDQDREYYYKVMNPITPFSKASEIQFQYSREKGQIVQATYDIPHNIFNYIRRGNRTLNNQTSKLEAEKEKAYQEAYKISILADPSLLLSSGSRKTSLAKYLESTIIMTLANKDISQEEQNIVDRALERLISEGNNVDDDESKDVNVDVFDQL